ALDEKRYFRSRGIVLPEVRTWRLPCTSMLGAAQAAFGLLEGYTLDGMQTWCNNALGVVSLFTGPGPVREPDVPF
ncbi:MAG: rolling circle replication-associated protein, partial [Telluria sp.]